MILLNCIQLILSHPIDEQLTHPYCYMHTFSSYVKFFGQKRSLKLNNKAFINVHVHFHMVVIYICVNMVTQHTVHYSTRGTWNINDRSEIGV